MKKIIEYFIKYPVAGNILIILLMVLGYLGLTQINSTLFPEVEPGYVTVTASYPGASPQEIETGVVLKIENNLRGMTGVKKITSTSMENYGVVVVELVSGYDQDVLLQEIKNEVDAISSFPSDMEPAQIKKVEWTATAVEMAIMGDVDLYVLKEQARKIEEDLLALEGITKVELSGFPDEEIEISFRENDLRAYNLTINEVAAVVYATNMDLTGGTIKGSDEELYIRSMSKEYYAADLEDIVIRTGSNGAQVLLRDVADVKGQWNEDPNLIFVDNEAALMVTINHTNEEDIIEISDMINTYAEQYNESNSVTQLKILRDNSERIDTMQSILLNNGAVGFLLVILFLSMFLNKRLSFWVAFSIPLSFMGMFLIASLAGITLNMMSLFGMILVIGILVDDGIVVAENIYQHYERGKKPLRAAVDGALEVLPAVFSGVLTTILAAGSILFIGGMMGQMFREMAIVVIAALSISLLECALILPTHIAHSKALTPEEKTSKVEVWLNKVMVWLREKIYLRILNKAIRNKAVTLSIVIGLFLVTLGGFAGGVIRMGDGGNEDTNQVKVSLTMPAGTPADITTAYLDEIEAHAVDVIKEFRALEGDYVVESLVMEVKSTTSGSVAINIVDSNEREFSSSDMSNAFMKKVGTIPEAEKVNFIEETRFGKPVSITLLSHDLDELDAATEDLKTELNQLSDLKNVEDNNELGMREVHIELNNLGLSLGIDLNTVISQVRSGFFGYEIQRLNRGQDEVKVWVRYSEDDRSSVGKLEDMRITTQAGESYPLSEIADLSYQYSVVSIKHHEGKREITVEADLMNQNANLTEIKSEINNVILPEIRSNYSNISVYLGGRDERQAELLGEIGTVVPIMLILLLAVIAFTFRSIAQTIIILLIVPLSLIGIGWGHFIHGVAVDMPSYLGIVILLGVIVNDSIVFINHMNNRLREGMTFIKSVLDAGKSRFRPIVLTSLTTIAGLSPIIISNNPTAGMVIPMAISVAYGLLVATLCTLFVLPTLLVSMNSIKRKWKKLTTGVEPTPEDVEQAVKELKAEQMM